MSANWVRFKSRVNDAEHPDAAMTYCDYRSTLPGTLRLMLPGTCTLEEVGAPDANLWHRLPPVFYETATYNVSIEFDGVAAPPIILHKLKEVTELFTTIPLDKSGNRWLHTAPHSFVNEPCIFELTFRYTPTEGAPRTDTFSFRVVSPKLDTKEDYNHILAEINAQYNEIIFQYLTLTLQNLQRGDRSNNDIVWLSIFRQIVADYVKAVTNIVNRPH